MTVSHREIKVDSSLMLYHSVGTSSFLYPFANIFGNFSSEGLFPLFCIFLGAIAKRNFKQNNLARIYLKSVQNGLANFNDFLL